MTPATDASLVPVGASSAPARTRRAWSDRETRPPGASGAAAVERALAQLSTWSPEALLCTDPYGVICAANPAAGELLGVEPRWMASKPLAVYVPLTARRVFRTGLASVLRDEGRSCWVQPMMRRDGERFVAVLSVALSRRVGGPQLLEWLIRERLEDDAEASALEAPSSKLRAARDHQERLGLLGTMTAMAVHDLSQPVGALRIYLDSLGTTGVSSLSTAELDHVIGKMRGQVARASDLLHNMRELAQRSTPEHRPTELASVLRAAVEHCAPYGRGALVELLASPALPAVWGNAVELEQVFVNLIMNALQAIEEVPADRRRLTVLAAAQGGVVEVRVRDEGLGFEGGELAVKGAFRSTRVGGLGLGLAICRMIVESHGGRVVVGAAPGCGSEIKVELPVTLEAPR